MGFKRIIQSLSLLFISFFLSTSVLAEFRKGPEGPKFYGGVNAGGFVIDVDGGDTSNGGLAGFVGGIEERNWALEAKLFVLYTTEDVDDKTTDLLNSISVVYRMPMRDDKYLKFKGGLFSYNDAGFESDGPVVGIGYGARMDNGHRWEIEYEYSDQSQDLELDAAFGGGNITIDFGVHMLSFQYLFGGSSNSFF